MLNSWLVSFPSIITERKNKSHWIFESLSSRVVFPLHRSNNIFAYMTTSAFPEVYCRFLALKRKYFDFLMYNIFLMSNCQEMTILSHLWKNNNWQHCKKL